MYTDHQNLPGSSGAEILVAEVSAQAAALGGEASRTPERWVADLPPGLHVGWLRCHPDSTALPLSKALEPLGTVNCGPQTMGAPA